MNKHCYRVIFSKTLQCLVVTSELSKTEGASSSSKMIKKPTALLGENWISDELHASLSKVSFTLFALLGFVLIPDALANDMAIRADKSAPGNQQPIILQTGSGVPQVNIQTPSAGGVSRNVYSQFDVSEKGAVLNNSRKGTGTQIAGYVAGNPNLARGEAKVILNEVNSANPSRLKGYVEVAGKKADVVIANPSGLQCDGCGVINAGRTTLTTGKPIVNNGELSGFEVKDGKISVGAKGMDASHSDYTDIIAKKTKIDGPIKGKQVKVITGKNRVSRDGSDVVYIGDKNDTATTQEYSLDVGELGGMYAGQIHLVDNGKGLGVRNAGHIGASVGDIQIDSQGNIVNSGVMQAEGNIKQKAKRKINNSGTTVSRKGNIKQQADGGIEQSGVLLAKGNRAEQKGNIEQQAAQINQSGNNIASGDIKIKGQQITLDKTSQSIAGMVFESNTVAKTAEKAIERNTEKTVTELTEQEIQRLPTLQASGSRVELQADTLTAQGQIIAQQAVVAEGNEVNLSHGRIRSYNIEAAAKGSLKADDAVLSAVNQAMLKATNVLSTNETQLTAEQIIANANQLNNNGGQWQQTGNDPLALHFAGGIENRGGHIQTAGALSINTANLNNAQGKLLSAKQATLQGGSVVNADGVIYSAEALSIQTGGLDNSRGHISNKQGDVSINTSKQLLINHQGTIASAAALSIAAGNTDNKEGVITAEQALSVNADSLNNSRGRLISNGQDIALNIATQLNNQVGTIAAQNVVNINGDLQNNKGVVLSEKGGVRVNSKAQIDNAEGVIQAAQAATLYSQGVDNSKGQIRGASLDIHSQGHQIRNGEGMIAGQSAVNLEGDLQNNKGVVLSEKGGVRVNSKAQIDNAEGVIQASQAVVLNSQGMDNNKGLIRGASVDIHSQGHQIRNSEGMIAGQSAVNLEGDLQNNKGVVLSEKGGVRVNGKAQIDNVGGVIQAAQAVVLHSQGVDNSKGLIRGASVDIHSQGHQIRNSEGMIAGQSAVNLEGDLHNNKGVVLSEKGGVRVNGKAQIDNAEGVIQAAQAVALNSQGVDNSKGLIRGASVDIYSQGHQIRNGEGMIAGQSAVNLEGDLQNTKGVVLSEKGGVRVNSKAQIDNVGGVIQAAQAVALNGQGVDNSKGLIKGKNVSLNSEGYQVVNVEGAITALNSITVNGNLNNQRGTLLSEQGDITVNSRSAVNNQQGLIHAATQATINSQGLDNQAGTVSANRLTINSAGQQVNNQQGTIVAQQQLNMTASTLDNREGYVISKGEAQLNLDTVHNQAISDKGSLISANKRLTLNATTVNNQDTKAKEGEHSSQGIIAGTLEMATGLLNNQGGNLYALENARLNVTGDVHNEGGLLYAGNQLDVLGSKQTLIHNQDGLIEGVGGLAVEANNFNDEGTLRSRGLGRIALQIDDYEYNKKFDFGALDFSVNGTLTNNVNAIYDRGVIFRAKNVKNNGTIGAYDKGATQIFATQGVENRGLIDGQFTLVKGETIRNVGQGRIYGDYLAMEAKQIYNGAETVASGKGTTTRAGTIAGREGLALAFEQMTNADGATVLSFGNTTIGRTLNEHYQAVGKADSLDNASGLINLMGNARVSVSRLTNRDSHIEDLLAKNNNRISLTQYQQHRAPGQFLVGGDLTLETDKVHNKYSQLLVGGNLTVNGEHIARQGSPLQTNSAHNALNEVLVNEDLSGKVYQLKKAQSNGFRWFKRHHRYEEQTIDNLGLTDNPLATVLGTQTTRYMTDQVNATDANFDNVNITGKDGQVRVQAQTILSPEQQQQIVKSGAVVSHYFDSTVQGSLLLNEGKTEISGGKSKGQNGQTEAARRTQLEDLPLTTVRTHLSDNQSLPTASYLQDNRNDPTAPLVSVDPILTKGQHGLSSDYLLKLTGQHSQAKRLGDGFYEQQLVREQINQLTGRRFLEGQTNDQAQYEALMNNGAKAAKELGLEVGKGLTAQQMSNLKQDIVWFVEREVAVPNEGNTLKGGRHREQGETPTTQTVKVLVPQVYTVSRHTDVIDKNAVISATNIIGQLNGKVNNSGAISALNLNQLHAEALENSGRINGRYVDIKTRGDVDNLGGKIEAAKALSVIAGGNINVSSHLKDVHIGDTQKRLIDKVAGLKVRDSDGLLQLVSDKDLRFNAATVESAGSLYAKAKGNMVVDSLRMTENTYSGGGDNFRRVRKEQDIGTVIQARDDLTLIGDQSFYAKAAQIVSENGRVHLQSNGDVNIVSGLAIDEEESKSKSKKRRRLGTSKKTTETYNYRYDETALASIVSGKTVSVVGNNIGVTASHLLANQDVIIQGKGRVKIEGELENHAQAYSHSVKKSGLSGSFKRGVLSVHLGTRKQGGGTDGKEQSVAVSSINSLNGNVMVSAGDKITINGSSVAARKNILLSGSDIELGAIYSHGDRSQHSYAKSSGIGVSLTLSPLLAAFDAARNHYKGNAGGGKSIIGKSTTFADSVDEFGQRLTKTLTFSIGGQSHSSENHSSTDNATVSQLRAGGNLILNATRGGIHSEGADFSAEGNFTALAKGDVVFGTAKNQYQANGYEKSHGHGIDTSKSFLKTLTLYKNKATEDAEKTTQKTTALSIGGNSFVKSGGNITTYGTDMAVVGDNIFMADGNITFGSTLEGAAQNRSAKGRGIGSAEISDTERFYGYYQNKESGYFNQRSYKGSVIGSEKGNIQVYAGGNYLQESSALLANAGKVSINAKQVKSIAHDNVTLSGNRTSDTKVGGFAKVSSPLIDLFNVATGARDTLRDDKAGDRMKAMKGAVLALQGYQAISDLSTGTIARVEVGTGIKHAHADYHEQDIRGQGNIINGAKGIEITAREGYIDLSQIDLATTTYNAQSQKNEVTSGSYVYLDGKRGINLRSGRDEFHAKGRQTGYSMVSGVGAQVGAQTGAYAYAEVGYNNATQQTDSHTKINSHIMTERLIAKTDGDMNLIGASAYADRIETDVKGKLNIVSEQSTAQYNAKGTNVGLRVQVSFGTAWNVGGSYGSNKTRSNYHGVQEQAGLFAGDGGYRINVQNHTNLEGGLITSSQLAETTGKNSFSTGTLSYSDIENHGNYSGSGLAISASVSMEGKSLQGMQKTAGYGKEEGGQHNITKSGINTANLHITDIEKQQQLLNYHNVPTGEINDGFAIDTPNSKLIARENPIALKDYLSNIKTDITTESLKQNPNVLQNNFDKSYIEDKVATKVAFTQALDQARQEVKKELYAIADKKRADATDIRRNNYIGGKNGYNTEESLELDRRADRLEKTAFYVDLALGSLYGWGNTDAIKYVGTAVATDPVVRAATAPEQIWLTTCKRDSLYCSNFNRDDSKRPTENGRAEIGDKRQIFDISELKPSDSNNVITISNNGIMNPLDAALKNAIKQNKWATNKEGVAVVYNRPTSNLLSELLYAAYDKTNDLLGGRLPLTTAEKANVKLYQYAKDNKYQIDLSNHSRGGLTASVALQYANRNGLTNIPIRESRFYGTATHVQDYANQLANVNGSYRYLDKNNQEKTSNGIVKSAVHYTDFVGRTPLIGLRSKYIVGGNEPTGGVENTWFTYSHSSYFAEIPSEDLINEKGDYIDEKGYKVEEKNRVANKYRDEFNEKWQPQKNNLNPSLPKIVTPE